MLIFFFDTKEMFQHGMKLGYAYNTLVGHGVFGGYTVDISKNKHFVLCGGAGVQVFPKAGDLIKEELGISGLSKIYAEVQPYIGFSLNWYLF